MEPHFLYPNSIPQPNKPVIYISSDPSNRDENTAQDEKIWPKWAKCAVCKNSEPSTNFLSLPCLHVLCSDSCVERTQSVSDCCPLCNATFKKCDLTPNKYLLEAYEKELKAQKLASLRCTYCYSGDPALTWCATCTNYLCEWCDKNHSRMKITCDHNVRPKEEGEKVHLNEPEFSDLCAVHSEFPLTSFCTTCESCLCERCIERPCDEKEGKSHQISDIKLITKKVKEEIQAAQNQISAFIGECKTREGKYGKMAQNVIEVQRKRLYNEFKDQLNKFYVILMKKEAELRTTILKEIRTRNKRCNLKKSLYHKMAIQGEHFVEITKDLIKNGSDITLFNSKKRLLFNKNQLLENFELITVDDKTQESFKETLVAPDPEVFTNITEALSRFGIMSASADKVNKDGGIIDPKTKAAEMELLKIKKQNYVAQREQSLSKLTALYGVQPKLPFGPSQIKRIQVTQNSHNLIPGKSMHLGEKAKVVTLPSSVVVLPPNNEVMLKTKPPILKNPQMLKVTDLIDANKRNVQSSDTLNSNHNEEIFDDSNTEVQFVSENSSRPTSLNKQADKPSTASQLAASARRSARGSSPDIVSFNKIKIPPALRRVRAPVSIPNGPKSGLNDKEGVTMPKISTYSKLPEFNDPDENEKERPVSPRRSTGLLSPSVKSKRPQSEDRVYKIAQSPGGLKINFKKIDAEVGDGAEDEFPEDSTQDDKPRIREGRRKQNFNPSEARTTIENSEPVIELSPLDRDEELDLIEYENIVKRLGKKNRVSRVNNRKSISVTELIAQNNQRKDLSPSSVKKSMRFATNRARNSEREETPPPILDKEGSFEHSPTKRKGGKRTREDEDYEISTNKRKSMKGGKKKNIPKEFLDDLDATKDFQIFHEEQMKITNIDENEDYCAVCRDGGAEVMICCDFCPKVFHKKCHMPVVDIVPEDDWQCMYCRKKEDIFAEAAAESPMAIKPTRRINGHNLLKACKFLAEIYKQKESLILRGQYDAYYFNKTGEKPYSLEFVRTCLTTAKPKNISDIESMVQMMRKMIFQAKELFKDQPINLNYTSDLERVFQATLLDFFPEFVNSEYLEGESSIEEVEKEKESPLEPSA